MSAARHGHRPCEIRPGFKTGKRVEPSFRPIRSARRY
jgi:hypothetical protein